MFHCNTDNTIENTGIRGIIYKRWSRINLLSCGNLHVSAGDFWGMLLRILRKIM